MTVHLLFVTAAGLTPEQEEVGPFLFEAHRQGRCLNPGVGLGRPSQYFAVASVEYQHLESAFDAIKSALYGISETGFHLKIIFSHSMALINRGFEVKILNSKCDTASQFSPKSLIRTKLYE